ncbi:DUF4373 domain-containing protein [Flagellimonas marinaquae]|uniref:Lin1244/Lin1753 domain-containing protein n=1 Tax=Flagellimonas aurea TaxID=2915619 RepID=UPI001CE1237E|nr:DUF4373 domain-containing protein [Allomuricauda aquimarina]
MPRPKKYNADYFSHDADMRNDPKIKALRRKFGLPGYAVWNMMLEILTDSDFFEHEWNELSMELLAGDFDVEPEFLKEVIEYCFLLKLLKNEEDKIFSEKMKDRFESLLDRRNRDVKRKKEEFSTGKTPKEGDIQEESTQRRLKETKGEENKIKKNTPKPPKGDSSKDSKNQEINWDKLLNEFNKITGKKSRVVPDKAKRQIKARLKEGYSRNQILFAIKNCHMDPYHQENPRFLTLEFISRADKLEKYAQEVSKKKPKSFYDRIPIA